MRFALVATGAAAVLAVPLAMSAGGPQMSGDEFLTAVRCAAYEDVSSPNANLGPVKMQLNAEARRQPAETAAQAHAEVSSIARQAVISQSGADGSMVAQQQARACAGGQFATGAGGSNAV